MILQIPVEGWFQGGEFHLKSRNETNKVFATSRNSHRYHHLTVFYDDSQMISEPLDTGSRLELVFDLCHDTNSLGRAPQHNPP